MIGEHHGEASHAAFGSFMLEDGRGSARACAAAEPGFHVRPPRNWRSGGMTRLRTGIERTSTSALASVPPLMLTLGLREEDQRYPVGVLGSASRSTTTS